MTDRPIRGRIPIRVGALGIAVPTTWADFEEVAVSDDRSAHEIARLRLDLLDAHRQVIYLLRYVHEQRERYPHLNWPEFDPRFVSPPR